jgi:hypothetical protein
MKKLLGLAAILVMGTLSLAAPKKGIFAGQIMDSQCAMMGSHDAMMKGVNAKDAKECSVKCAKMGGKLVLYNSADKNTYQLDDQKKSMNFAGQKVNVSGTLDEGTKTIHVEKIGPAS